MPPVHHPLAPLPSACASNLQGCFSNSWRPPPEAPGPLGPRSPGLGACLLIKAHGIGLRATGKRPCFFSLSHSTISTGDSNPHTAEGDGQWRKVDFVHSTSALMVRLLQPQLQFRLGLRFRRGKSHYGKRDGSRLRACRRRGGDWSNSARRKRGSTLHSPVCTPSRISRPRPACIWPVQRGARPT
jgi:hypothetical protein